MNECTFKYSDSVCKILKICNCTNCRFRKTEEEYAEGIANANKRLKDKGLVQYKKTVDGIQIMSTRKDDIFED